MHGNLRSCKCNRSHTLGHWRLTPSQSKNGIWAGHLWESSTSIDGGSSFLHRYGTGRKDVRVRGKDEFEKIAVNIFDKPLPTGRRGVDPKTRPNWKSLPDVANSVKFGEPFKGVGDVEVFILTKARSYVCSH